MNIYPQTKICSECKEPKTLDCFSKNSWNKDGKHRTCKLCNCAYQTTLRSSLTPEQKERNRINDKKYYSNLSQEKRAKKSLRQKAWHSNLTPEQRERQAVLRRSRYANDIDHRLRQVMRSRLTVAKKYKKPCSAVKDLGCSWEHFKEHIQSKFTEGMSWDNYGQWRIDHIHPLSRVDFNIKEEVQRACHYTNLQPLWALDNRKKSDNI